MTVPVNSLRSALVGLVLVAVAGCGGGKSRTVPVEGVVTLDGQPLSGAMVHFLPQGTRGPAATGATGSDGSFKLTTYNTGDGAVPGDYKIIITYKEPDSGIQQVAPNDPKAMADAMKTFNDSSRKAQKTKAKTKSKVPDAYSKEETTTLKQRVPADGPVKIDLNSKGS
jgi:hypothetical protein